MFQSYIAPISEFVELCLCPEVQGRLHALGLVYTYIHIYIYIYICIYIYKHTYI